MAAYRPHIALRPMRLCGSAYEKRVGARRSRRRVVRRQRGPARRSISITKARTRNRALRERQSLGNGARLGGFLYSGALQFVTYT